MKIPEPHLLVLNQFRVLSPTKLALDVLRNVLLKQVFNIVRVQECLNDQTTITNGPGSSTEVLEEEVHHVLRMTIELLTKENEVSDRGLLRSYSLDLWRFQHNFCVLGEIGIVLG